MAAAIRERTCSSWRYRAMAWSAARAWGRSALSRTPISSSTAPGGRGIPGGGGGRGRGAGVDLRLPARVEELERIAAAGAADGQGRGVAELVIARVQKALQESQRLFGRELSEPGKTFPQHLRLAIAAQDLQPQQERALAA